MLNRKYTRLSIALDGGIFLLLAGEKALEVFGTFLLVALNPNLQQHFTNLRNTSSFPLRYFLQFLLQIRGDAKCKGGILSHGR